MIILSLLLYLYWISATQLYHRQYQGKHSLDYADFRNCEDIITPIPSFLYNWLPFGHHWATSLSKYRKWHLNFSFSKSHPITIPHIPVARERCECFMNFTSSLEKIKSNATAFAVTVSLSWDRNHKILSLGILTSNIACHSSSSFCYFSHQLTKRFLSPLFGSSSSVFR